MELMKERRYIRLVPNLVKKVLINSALENPTRTKKISKRIIKSSITIPTTSPNKSGKNLWRDVNHDNSASKRATQEADSYSKSSIRYDKRTSKRMVGGISKKKSHRGNRKSREIEEIMSDADSSSIAPYSRLAELKERKRLMARELFKVELEKSFSPLPITDETPINYISAKCLRDKNSPPPPPLPEKQNFTITLQRDNSTYSLMTIPPPSVDAFNSALPSPSTPTSPTTSDSSYFLRSIEHIEPDFRNSFIVQEQVDITHTVPHPTFKGTALGLCESGETEEEVDEIISVAFRNSTNLSSLNESLVALVDGSEFESTSADHGEVIDFMLDNSISLSENTPDNSAITFESMDTFSSVSSYSRQSSKSGLSLISLEADVESSDDNQQEPSPPTRRRRPSERAEDSLRIVPLKFRNSLLRSNTFPTNPRYNKPYPKIPILKIPNRASLSFPASQYESNLGEPVFSTTGVSFNNYPLYTNYDSKRISLELRKEYSRRSSNVSKEEEECWEDLLDEPHLSDKPHRLMTEIIPDKIIEEEEMEILVLKDMLNCYSFASAEMEEEEGDFGTVTMISSIDAQSIISTAVESESDESFVSARSESLYSVHSPLESIALDSEEIYYDTGVKARFAGAEDDDTSSNYSTEEKLAKTRKTSFFKRRLSLLFFRAKVEPTLRKSGSILFSVKNGRLWRSMSISSFKSRSKDEDDDEEGGNRSLSRLSFLNRSVASFQRPTTPSLLKKSRSLNFLNFSFRSTPLDLTPDH